MTIRRERKEELWRINNRPDLSKASLMGCDRNLFTLRLVLNQKQGEWQWQSAAEGCSRGAGVAEKTVRVWIVAQVQHYNPSVVWTAISKAFGIQRRMERWSGQGMCARTNDE